MKFLVLGALALLSLPGLSTDFERDPVGESAYYEIDASGGRTSSMIRSGEMTASVTQFVENHSQGPSYEVQLDYVFRIVFVGTRSGSEVTAIPAEYFSSEFMEQLRRDGEYHTDQFSARHLGYGDARNMDGRFYHNCDRVLIYNVQTASPDLLTAMALKLLGVDPSRRGDIEDLEIQTMIYPEVPVLGAVKLDVSGVYQGTSVKAGSDYMP
jgi:hypothetical protein